MARSCLAVLVCGLCVLTSSLKLERDETDMVDNDIEFPFEAVDDALAGAPGSGNIVPPSITNQGISHVTPADDMNEGDEDDEEQPETPCDDSVAMGNDVADGDAIVVVDTIPNLSGNTSSVGANPVAVTATPSVVSTTFVYGSIRFDCPLPDWTAEQTRIFIMALANKTGVNASSIYVTDILDGSTIVVYKIKVQSVDTEASEGEKDDVAKKAERITLAIIRTFESDFGQFLVSLGMPSMAILSYVSPTVSFEGAQPFACRATNLWADTDPSTAVKFNLYRAQFEGNDRAGVASAAEYDVTDCGCQCSGVNGQCGLAGSTSYYSGVDSAQACALMICHSNQFSKCMWQSEVVAQGGWFNDAVKFYSTVLQSEEGPADHVVTLTARNNTKPTNSSRAGLLNNFPTPTPTPDQSPEQIVNLKAVGVLGALRDKACLQTAPAFVSYLMADLASFNISSASPVVCVYHASDILNNLEGAMSTYDTVDNALAGYDQNSPLAADPTRHATLSMNDLSSMLLQSSPAPTDQATWNLALQKIITLLSTRVPPEVQCVNKEWSVADVVGEALGLSVACDSLTMITNNSTDSFYSTLVAQLVDVVGVSAPVEADEEGEGMNPGLFGGDQSAEDKVDEAVEGGMMGVGPDVDCDEQTANADLNLAANSLQVQDTEGRKPGSRLPVAVPVVGDNMMPAFGSVSLDFPPRDAVGVVTVSQPPQTEG